MSGPPKRQRIAGNAEKNAEMPEELRGMEKWPTNQYVVNVRNSTPEVYVGRRNPRFAPEDCSNYKWGNPFKGEGSLLKYYHYIYKEEILCREAKQELKGKTLGCWCYPKPCHAMVLAKIANQE